MLTKSWHLAFLAVIHNLCKETTQNTVAAEKRILLFLCLILSFYINSVGLMSGKRSHGSTILVKATRVPGDMKSLET